MDSQQGFKAGTGVVLSRRIVGEGDLLLVLLLKEIGLVRASARGAASGKIRFGGGTEPLVWGSFRFYKGKHGGLYLRSVDIADDMLKLRGRPAPLLTALRWSKLLMRHLMAEHPANDLLANLYWNMKLLEDGVPVEVVEWRFLWRWLKNWGLAPDLSLCFRCGAPLAEAVWLDDGFACPRCARDGRETLSAVDFSFLRVTAEAGGERLRDLLTRCGPPDGRFLARCCRHIEELLIVP